jgi:hypothetical protein
MAALLQGGQYNHGKPPEIDCKQPEASDFKASRCTPDADRAVEAAKQGKLAKLGQ